MGTLYNPIVELPKDIQIVNRGSPSANPYRGQYLQAETYICTQE